MGKVQQKSPARLEQAVIEEMHDVLITITAEAKEPISASRGG